MNNFFGLKIPEIKKIAKDKRIEKNIVSMFLSFLEHLGVPEKKREEIINKIIRIAKEYNELDEYERKTHKILEKEGITRKVSKKFGERAEIIYNQVKDYVKGEKVLDLGCGDGKVGELLSKGGFNVVLADVVKHPNIDNLNLNFKLFDKEKKVPFKDNTFDTTLIITVIHHADNPLKVIKEVYRVTKPNGMVIAIETVYDVKGEGLTKEQKEEFKDFLTLSDEEQRDSNIFFDHFWNRVQQFSDKKENKINVPNNHNTPSEWNTIFKENGLEQEKTIHLGIDQPTAPEYHTLHILKVIK